MRRECPDAMQQPEGTCVSNAAIHHADKPGAYKTTYRWFLPIPVFFPSQTQWHNAIALLIQGRTHFSSKKSLQAGESNSGAGFLHQIHHNQATWPVPFQRPLQIQLRNSDTISAPSEPVCSGQLCKETSWQPLSTNEGRKYDMTTSYLLGMCSGAHYLLVNVSPRTEHGHVPRGIKC